MQSTELQENIEEINCIFYSENIFSPHRSDDITFWITSDFFIDYVAMHFFS